MATWDETAPAGSTLRSLGDDAIKQFKTDIRERLAAEHVSGDGSAISDTVFTEARHKLSSVGLLGLVKGLRIEQRSYATSGNITISGKLQIEINGDMCYLNSDTNLAFSGLTASTSYYIYAASPGHETELTAGNFSYSSTAPTYSTAKKGWYNVNSRAIGFFRVTSNNYMLPFLQSTCKYTYTRAFGYTTAITSAANTSWTEITGVANFVAVFGGLAVTTVCYVYAFSADNSLEVFLSSDGTDTCTKIRVTVGAADNMNNIDAMAECPLSAARTLYYRVQTNTRFEMYILGFDLDGSL